MIRLEDSRSLLAMANREDLHVAFTRHRANARMFVQDIGVLRQVANRSLIKDLAARDLETRKMVGVAERPGAEKHSNVFALRGFPLAKEKPYGRAAHQTRAAGNGTSHQLQRAGAHSADRPELRRLDGGARSTIAFVRSREAMEARKRKGHNESEPGYYDLFKHSRGVIVFDRAGTLVGIKKS